MHKDVGSELSSSPSIQGLLSGGSSVLDKTLSVEDRLKDLAVHLPERLSDPFFESFSGRIAFQVGDIIVGSSLVSS